MLDDLDRTLLNVVVAEVASLDAGHVHFEAPDTEFRPATPALSLFLYDVRENADLRDNDWLLDRQDNGGVVKRRAPRRVDCSYLITAWAGDSWSEHLLLGQVLQGLLRHPVIGDPFLANTLQGLPPLTATILQPSLLQAIGEFWQAMGNKPRAALNYTVTVAVDVSAPQDAFQVKEPVIRIKQKEQ